MRTNSNKSNPVKQRYRKTLMERRASLSADKRLVWDRAIQEQLMSQPFWDAAQVLCTYYAVGAEVQTQLLISTALEQEKHVLLPRVVKGRHALSWHSFTSETCLERSSFGVLEPPLDAPSYDPICLVGKPLQPKLLVVVPGLTFDTQGYRLGYGGGFYDTFLSSLKANYTAWQATTSVGVCRHAQLANNLSELGLIEPHDIPVDVVVTNKTVLTVRLQH